MASQCHPVQFFVSRVSLLLMLSLGVTVADTSCRNRLDIVVAVDTTSSLTVVSFENVKAEVKGIVSGFKIGEQHTRLALVSVSRQSQVVVNFDRVKSLSDFTAAVDKLAFSSDTAELSYGIRVAKDFLRTATSSTGMASKILILVKDRRSFHPTVSDAAVMSRVTSEAADVKALGAVIHAVGIGGVWIKRELEALYGSDYLLFKNRNKEMESLMSLNNKVCEANCPNKGTETVKRGLCYRSKRHEISTRVNLADNEAGESVCRTVIDRSFGSCDQSEQEACSARNMTVGACQNDKITIVSTWQSFDPSLQSCVTSTVKHVPDCADALNCPDQVADVIFLLDKSGSIGPFFSSLKNATLDLIRAMNIGPRNVRVGIIKFGSQPEIIVPLGSINDKQRLIEKAEKMSTIIMCDTYGFCDGTETHLGLKQARAMFAQSGRPNVARFLFLMTVGRSQNPDLTFSENKLLKNFGVTVYAIGIKDILLSELETMTAPESATNLFLLREFDDLKSWAQSFSKKLCIQLAPPIPKLCDDNVFFQSVSECTNGQQVLSRTEYKYDSQKRCLKSIYVSEQQYCKKKCIDPIDGNEYFDGDTWTNLCHEFRCYGSGQAAIPYEITQCLAADGTCEGIGNQKFRCRNSNGMETENCQCLTQYGRAMTVIDTL